MSKQSDYQARRVAAGLCRQCGKRPIHPESKSCCYHCIVKKRTRQREKLGYKPQHKSKRGRIPFFRIPTSELVAEWKSDLHTA